MRLNKKLIYLGIILIIIFFIIGSGKGDVGDAQPIDVMSGLKYAPGQLLIKIKPGYNIETVYQNAIDYWNLKKSANSPLYIIEKSSTSTKVTEGVTTTQATPITILPQTYDLSDELLSSEPKRMLETIDDYDISHGLDRVYVYKNPDLLNKAIRYLEEEAIVSNSHITYKLNTIIGEKSLDTINSIDPYTLQLYTLFLNQDGIEQVGLNLLIKPIPIISGEEEKGTFIDFVKSFFNKAVNYVKVKITARIIDIFERPDELDGDKVVDESELDGGGIVNESNGSGKEGVLGKPGEPSIEAEFPTAGQCTGDSLITMLCDTYDNIFNECPVPCSGTFTEEEGFVCRGQITTSCSQLGRNDCYIGGSQGCYIYCEQDSNCFSGWICNTNTHRCDRAPPLPPPTTCEDLSPDNSPITSTLSLSSSTKLCNKEYNFDIGSTTPYPRPYEHISAARGIEITDNNIILDCNGATLSATAQFMSIISIRDKSNIEIRNCNFKSGSRLRQFIRVDTSQNINIHDNSFRIDVATSPYDRPSPTAISIDTLFARIERHSSAEGLLPFSDSVIIKGNTFTSGDIKGLYYGIESFASNLQVLENTFNDIRAYAISATEVHADVNTITNSHNGAGAGIHMKNGLIENNLFNGMGGHLSLSSSLVTDIYGIHVESYDDKEKAVVTKNKFTNPYFECESCAKESPQILINKRENVEISDNEIIGTSKRGQAVGIKVEDADGGTTEIPIKISNNRIRNIWNGVKVEEYTVSIEDNIIENSLEGIETSSTAFVALLDNDICNNDVDFSCNRANYIQAGNACDKFTKGIGCPLSSCSFTCAEAKLPENQISVTPINLGTITLDKVLKVRAKVRHKDEQPQYVKLKLKSKLKAKTPVTAQVIGETEYELTPTSDPYVYQLDVGSWDEGDYSADLTAGFTAGTGSSTIQFNLAPVVAVGPIELTTTSGNCEEENDVLKRCSFSKADDILFKLKINDEQSKIYNIYINDVFVGILNGQQAKDFSYAIFQPDLNTLRISSLDGSNEFSIDVYAYYFDFNVAKIEPVRPSEFIFDFLFYKPDKPNHPELDSVNREYFAFKASGKNSRDEMSSPHITFLSITGLQIQELSPMKIDTDYNYYSVLPEIIKNPRNLNKDLTKGHIWVRDKFKNKANFYEFYIKMSEIHDWALESYGESYIISGQHFYESEDPDINYFEATKYDFKMGENVKVALLDSGVKATNSYLRNRIFEGFSVRGNSLSDPADHGTMTGGIIASDRIEDEFTGIAPKAKIYSYNVFDFARESEGDNIICDALNDAIDKKFISLTSNSWTVDNFKSVYSDTGKLYFDVLSGCFEKAKLNNIISFTASGNCAVENPQEGNCDRMWGVENSLPSAFEQHVFTVGAISIDNKIIYRAEAWGSGIDGYLDFGGDFMAWFPPTQNILDFVTPGDSFSSLTQTGYSRTVAGATSASTPVAAGIAAVIMSNCNVPLSVYDVEIIMRNGADSNVDIDRPRWSGPKLEYYRGLGKLKLDKALEYMYDNYPQCVGL